MYSVCFWFVFSIALYPEEVQQGQKVKDNNTRKLLRTAFLTFGSNVSTNTHNVGFV